MVVRLTLLALAGASGTLARYGCNVALQDRSSTFPWATFVVNVLGCLAFGVAWGVLDRRGQLHGDLRLVVLTGFLGAFTTFSAFLFEGAKLAHDGRALASVASIGGQLVLGSLLLAVGIAVGRQA
ncbi:MAG: Camphor resistance CrcB protein [Thermoleophilia bacterium]|nr:Camphor resistance CrcB protein [Thermoleophilia bacterium]